MLKELKDTISGAYADRDKFKKVAEDAEAAKHDAEVKAAKDKGDEKQALQLELDKRDEQFNQLMALNTTLSRDNMVKEALAGIDFDSAKAVQYAASDISASLKRTDDGNWVGKGGESITDLVQAFVKEKENSFLLNKKENKGSGDIPKDDGKPTDDDKRKPGDKMSVQDYFKDIKSGKIEVEGIW